ncbi:hypothetical protein QFC22_003057 [Naganishia vaughanmartiniae]|uniref:Uncharacterized protein n=1 Tax=Naganishia vaughanmartiniae TaxID=1424756 RepID=A0ACC2X807_9TREE|nr:hypothetical protein QFC22_003057 [Naganishia vaughanmartiniae]
MILPQGDSSPKHSACDENERAHKVEKGASFHEVTAVDSVPPIRNINSAFQMAEYLNLLVQADPHDISRIIEVPEYHSQKPSKTPSSNATSESREQDLQIIKLEQRKRAGASCRSHAWYAHRELFEEAEAETALYKRFLALMKRYGLMNLSLLVIPGDAYDTPTVTNGPATQSPTGQTSDQDATRPQHKNTASVLPTSKISTSEIPNSKACGNPKSDDLKKAIKKDEDDADFRRDLFATPVTATRIDHGFKNMLRGDGTSTSRGTLGRGRGKGVRKALFPVDVPAEEEDDEVDIHVEHVGVMTTNENGKSKGKAQEVEGRNEETNVNTEKSASSVAAEESKTTSTPESADKGNEESEEEEEKAEPNITADGIEFNV